ncbi:MAG: hypothetical protein V1726_04485 [Methanobacteriota archaeon]
MITGSDETWMQDLQEFISYWEKEVDVLKERKLDSEECCEIADLFHRDRDLLLCRRPTNVFEEEVVSRLLPLTSKLDVSLAMALCSIKLKDE